MLEQLAELCERLGIVFIGPSAALTRKVADRIQMKLIAEKAELSMSAWSRGPVVDLADARRQAAMLGYPVDIHSATVPFRRRASADCHKCRFARIRVQPRRARLGRLLRSSDREGPPDRGAEFWRPPRNVPCGIRSRLNRAQNESCGPTGGSTSPALSRLRVGSSWSCDSAGTCPGVRRRRDDAFSVRSSQSVLFLRGDPRWPESRSPSDRSHHRSRSR